MVALTRQDVIVGARGRVLLFLPAARWEGARQLETSSKDRVWLLAQFEGGCAAVLGCGGGEQRPGPWQGSTGSCACSWPEGSLLAISGQAAARAGLVCSVQELFRVKEEADAGAERDKHPAQGCGL